MKENLDKRSSFIFSVSEASSMIRKTVEDIFSAIKIRGEVSGYKKAASGHVYFSLKDSGALINVICWKNIAESISLNIEDGMEVICSGSISTYPGRSSYQLIVKKVEISGKGSLLALLERKKEELQKEGLFSPECKKKIPYLPNSIGIITSLQGAVIKDILHRIKDRFPLQIITWDVPVQGREASEKIVKAIDGFNNLKDGKPDLLIIARGGGSVEDLWCFNEENVVRSVAKSDIPVVSAIGHETDFTLTDFAADLRAPTPTAAAELAVPLKSELIRRLDSFKLRSANSMNKIIENKGLRLNSVKSSLGKFYTHIESQKNYIKSLKFVLDNNMEGILSNKRTSLSLLDNKLSAKNTLNSLESQKSRLRVLKNNLENAVGNIFSSQKNKLDVLSKSLKVYDKESTLKRGFSIIRDNNGEVLSSVKKLIPGQEVKIELHEGQRKATVQ